MLGHVPWLWSLRHMNSRAQGVGAQILEVLFSFCSSFVESSSRHNVLMFIDASLKMSQKLWAQRNLWKFHQQLVQSSSKAAARLRASNLVLRFENAPSQTVLDFDSNLNCEPAWATKCRAGSRLLGDKKVCPSSWKSLGLLSLG